jgi:hypothetical protein
LVDDKNPKPRGGENENALTRCPWYAYGDTPMKDPAGVTDHVSVASEVYKYPNLI